MVVYLVVVVLRLAAVPRRLFERYVFHRAAPFRSVDGPYVLVLRSFANRMVIGRRIRRIVRDASGRILDAEAALNTPDMKALLNRLPDNGRRLDLGNARPDLTTLTFLAEVSHQHAQTFVGVSNGSSLGGVLRLVHAPDDRWFDAMKVLADHAKAILVIPDGSPGLVQEVAHAMSQHPTKVAFLMPPSDTKVELRRDVLKEYLFEGIDLTAAWSEASDALQPAGVSLPPYNPAGGLIRCHDDGSICDAVWNWGPDELAELIALLDSGDSDARAARRSLSAIGLRFRRYRAPPGRPLDEAWYERQFQEDFHIRDPEKRSAVSAALPWLGMHRADHIMNAPAPGSDAAKDSPRLRPRCAACDDGGTTGHGTRAPAFPQLTRDRP